MARSLFEGGAARRIELKNLEAQREREEEAQKKRGRASVSGSTLQKSAIEQREAREQAESQAEADQIRQAMSAAETPKLVEKKPATETRSAAERIVEAKQILGQQYAADMWDAEFAKSRDKDVATKAVFAKAEKLRGLDMSTLGMDKAEKVYDEVRALTNDKNAKEYVNALSKVYAGKDVNSADVAALNRKYNIPKLANRQEYDPLMGSGGSRLLETHALGGNTARTEMGHVIQRVTGGAEARHEKPKAKLRQREYPIAEGKVKPIIEMTPETIEQWRKDLLIENEELHRKLAEQQTERVSPEKAANIAATSKQITEVQDRLSRMEQYKMLSTEMAEKGIKYEDEMHDLEKQLEIVSAKIIKTYGKSPEELVTVGGFGTYRAKFTNWLNKIQGQPALLDEWRALNSTYQTAAQLLENYQATYKRAPSGRVVRIPGHIERLEEAHREEVAPRVEVGRNVSTEEYEAGFNIYPDLPRAKELYELVEKNANAHAASEFLKHAEEYLNAAQNGVSSAMKDFESVLDGLGIENEPAVKILVAEAHERFEHSVRTHAPPKPRGRVKEESSFVIAPEVEAEGWKAEAEEVERQKEKVASKKREKEMTDSVIEQLNESLVQLEVDLNRGRIDTKGMAKSLRELMRQSHPDALKRDHPNLKNLSSDPRVKEFFLRVTNLQKEFSDKANTKSPETTKVEGLPDWLQPGSEVKFKRSSGNFELAQIAFISPGLKTAVVTWNDEHGKSLSKEVKVANLMTWNAPEEVQTKSEELEPKQLASNSTARRKQKIAEPAPVVEDERAAPENSTEEQPSI